MKAPFWILQLAFSVALAVHTPVGISTPETEPSSVESLQRDLSARLSRGEFVSARILLERLALARTLLKGFPIPFSPQSAGYAEFHMRLAGSYDESAARTFLFEPLTRIQRRVRLSQDRGGLMVGTSFVQDGATESFRIAADSVVRAYPQLKVSFLDTIDALLSDIQYTRDDAGSHLKDWLHSLRKGVDLEARRSELEAPFPIPFSPEPTVLVNRSASQRLADLWHENSDQAVELFIEMAQASSVSFATFVPVRMAFWRLQHRFPTLWSAEQQGRLALAIERRISEIEDYLHRTHQPALQSILFEEHLALIDLRAGFPIPFSPEFTLKAASPLEQLAWSPLSEVLNARLPSPPSVRHGFPIPFLTEPSYAIEAPYHGLSLGAFAPLAAEAYWLRLALEGRPIDLKVFSDIEGWRSEWVEREIRAHLRSPSFLESPESPLFVERLIEKTVEHSPLLHLYAELIHRASELEHWKRWYQRLEQQEWRIAPVDTRRNTLAASSDSLTQSSSEGLWDRVKNFFSKAKTDSLRTVSLEPQFRVIQSAMHALRSENTDCDQAFRPADSDRKGSP